MDFFQKNVGMEKWIHDFCGRFFLFFARIVLLIHFEEWIHAGCSGFINLTNRSWLENGETLGLFGSYTIYPVVFQIS